jgi:hypothetical protein
MNRELSRFGRFGLALSAVAALLLLGTTVAAAKPDAKQTKVNVYVDMLNNWSSYVYKSRGQYGDTVDMAAGPTCKERNLRGPSSIGPTAKKTFAAYQKALAKKPKLPVDAAAKEMAAVLIELWEPSNEASEYYFKRKFKDDDCKRGQELHGQLVALWERYAVADREVRAFVEQFNDERQIKEVAKTKKKYGPRLRYHYEQLLIDGKALIRVADGELRNETPDLDGIRTALATFTATLESTEALVAKDRDNKKVYNDLYQGGYTQFVKHATWFREAVEKSIKTVEAPAMKPGRGGKPDQPDKQRPEKIEKGRTQTVDAYNRMIDAANKVRLSKAIK